jgi:hypothetical protein
MSKEKAGIKFLSAVILTLNAVKGKNLGVEKGGVLLDSPIS